MQRDIARPARWNDGTCEALQYMMSVYGAKAMCKGRRLNSKAPTLSGVRSLCLEVGCDVTEIRKCVDSSLQEIIDGVIDPCNTPIACKSV